MKKLIVFSLIWMGSGLAADVELKTKTAQQAFDNEFPSQNGPYFATGRNFKYATIPVKEGISSWALTREEDSTTGLHVFKVFGTNKYVFFASTLEPESQKVLNTRQFKSEFKALLRNIEIEEEH